MPALTAKRWCIRESWSDWTKAPGLEGGWAHIVAATLSSRGNFSALKGETKTAQKEERNSPFYLGL